MGLPWDATSTKETKVHIDIHASGFNLTDGLRDHARRKIAHALDHFGFPGGRIRVRLSDINGPRGGLDKRCQIHISLPRRDHVIVEDIESDLYIAIDRAAERAGESLRRRHARQRAQLKIRSRQGPDDNNH